MSIEYTRHEQQILDEAERRYHERKKKIEQEKGKLSREDYYSLDQDRLAEAGDQHRLDRDRGNQDVRGAVPRREGHEGDPRHPRLEPRGRGSLHRQDLGHATDSTRPTGCLILFTKLGNSVRST